MKCPPEITELPAVIDPILCQNIINTTRPKMTPALVGKSILRVASPARRAMNYKYRQDLAWTIEVRKQVAQLAEVNLEFVEPVEVVCYQQGGYYFRHNDGEDRSHTFVAYLSDAYTGGELYFDKLDALFTKIPIGTGIFYENLPKMRHECRQVTSGEKWCMCVWVSKYNSYERVQIGRDIQADLKPTSSIIHIP